MADWHGHKISEVRYTPWGETRWAWDLDGAGYTNRLYTSQLAQNRNYVGQLYDYGARFYCPQTGRFTSADSIVPEPSDPQSLNRYSYVQGNPLIRVDPTGHEDTSVSPIPPPGWLVNIFLRGTVIHAIIEADFAALEKNVGKAYGNNLPPLPGAPNDAKYTIKGGGPNGGDGHPDMYYVKSGLDKLTNQTAVKQIWEIKSDNPAQLDSGRDQLKQYKTACGNECTFGTFYPESGQAGNRTITIIPDVLNLQVRYVEPGLLAYKIERPERKIKVPEQLKELNKFLQQVLNQLAKIPVWPDLPPNLRPKGQR